MADDKMTRQETRELIREVLREQAIHITRSEEASTQRILRTTLTALGIIVSPTASEDEMHAQLLRFQDNIRHTDKWRRSVQQVERVGWGTAVAVVASGFLGAVWLGFKAMVGK